MFLYECNKQHNHRQSGFTLLEILTVVLIGGITLAIGLPSFMGLVKSNRLSAQTNALLSSMHLARNEAVNRGHNIRILPISGTTNWASGWQVRLDVDNDGVADTEDTILRSYDEIQNAGLLGSANSITYEFSGFATAATTLTLTADICTASDVRIISVKLSGLASSKKDQCPP